MIEIIVTYGILFPMAVIVWIGLLAAAVGFIRYILGDRE